MSKRKVHKKRSGTFIIREYGDYTPGLECGQTGKPGNFAMYSEKWSAVTCKLCLAKRKRGYEERRRVK